MKGVNIQDPVMQEFVENLDKVNAIAEHSEGFIWRLKDETNNATAFDPYQDEQVIINISVWQSIELLEKFMYQTLHVEFLKRRKEWFHTFGKLYTAMWWIPEGQFPSIQEQRKSWLICRPTVHPGSYLILKTNIYQDNKGNQLTMCQDHFNK